MATLGQYNLSTMSQQEVFEASAIHLLEQNKKSISPTDDGECLYNGDDLCCAAGIFIQNYVPQMENNGWLDLIDEFYQNSQHKWLVCDLQSIHDTKEVKNWYKHLLNLSNRYDLDTTFLEKFKPNI